MLLYPKQKTTKKRMKHPKSIMHNKEDKTCYLCMLMDGNYQKHSWLHEHHIFGGDPNRSHSEEYGLKIYLCVPHHQTGKFAVHRCQETQDLLHKIGQREFEERYSRQQFVDIFGKNYLEE